MSGIWSCKFYGANDLKKKTTIVIGAFERTYRKSRDFGSLNEVLLKEDRSYNVPVSGSLLVIIFVLPKF